MYEDSNCTTLKNKSSNYTQQTSDIIGQYNQRLGQCSGSNQTIINQTIINQTIINQTIINQTEVSQNETWQSNYTYSNFTNMLSCVSDYMIGNFSYQNETNCSGQKYQKEGSLAPVYIKTVDNCIYSEEFESFVKVTIKPNPDYDANATLNSSQILPRIEMKPIDIFAP